MKIKFLLYLSTALVLSSAAAAVYFSGYNIQPQMSTSEKQEIASAESAPPPSLGPGDIMFVAFLFDGNGTNSSGACSGDCGDGFAFVALENIDMGTVIYFTEEEYNGTQFVPPPMPSDDEGSVVWTATSAVPAGTVVTITTNSQSETCPTTIGASTGTLAYGTMGSFELSSSSEEIYAYLGSEESPTTWLAAMETNAGNTFPTELTSPTNFVLDFETFDQSADMGIYTGSLNGANKSAVQTVILNIGANWTLENGGANNTSNCPGQECCDNDGVNYPADIPAGFTGLLPSLSEVGVTVSPSSVDENSVNNLVYTFTRTAPTTSALTINFDVTGTATFSTDYTQSGAASFNASSGTVTIPAGQPNATVTIDPTGDTDIEPDETIILTITSNPTVYTIGANNPATGTITNDDLPEVEVTVNPGSTPENGAGNLVYTFTRSGPTTSALTVDFDVTGTALINSDYTTTGFNGTMGSISIPANMTMATIIVDPSTDNIVENDEEVTLTISINANYTIGSNNAATGTISNDDIPGFAVTESGGMTMTGEDGSTDNFTVVLSALPASGNVVIDLTVDAGFMDEISLSSTSLTFNSSNGLMAQTITVTGLGDSDADGDQMGNITLSINPAASNDAFDALSDQTVSVTNKDDEPLIQVEGNNVVIMDGDNSPILADFTNFGVFQEPDAPGIREFIIENVGGSISTLEITNITTTLSPCFSIVNPNPPMLNIPGGSNAPLQIQFDPSGLATGFYSATITVTSNTNGVPNSPFTFLVQASVFDPNSIPTMGEWAFFLFGLGVFTLMIVALYNIKRSTVNG